MSATATSSRYSSRVSNDVDDRLDRLDVADDVVRGDVRERVGDVVREVVLLAQRLRDVARLGPASEREQRERRGVAAIGELGRRGAELERPPRELLDGRLVAREQRRLQRADRPAPRSRDSPRSQLSRQRAAARRSQSAASGRPPSAARGRRHRRRCPAARARARRARRAAPRTGTVSRRRRESNSCSYVVQDDMETNFHGLTFVTDPGRVFAPRASTEAARRCGARADRRPRRRASPTSARARVRSRSRSRCARRSSRCGRATRAAARSRSRSANAERLGAQVHLVKGDLLDGLPRDLDLIVANLPYLAPGRAGLRRRAGGCDPLDRRRARPLPAPDRRRRRPPGRGRRRADPVRRTRARGRAQRAAAGCARGSSRSSPPPPRSTHSTSSVGEPVRAHARRAARARNVNSSSSISETRSVEIAECRADVLPRRIEMHGRKPEPALHRPLHAPEALHLRQRHPVRAVRKASAGARPHRCRRGRTRDSGSEAATSSAREPAAAVRLPAHPVRSARGARATRRASPTGNTVRSCLPALRSSDRRLPHAPRDVDVEPAPAERTPEHGLGDAHRLHASARDRLGGRLDETRANA